MALLERNINSYLDPNPCQSLSAAPAASALDVSFEVKHAISDGTSSKILSWLVCSQLFSLSPKGWASQVSVAEYWKVVLVLL